MVGTVGILAVVVGIAALVFAGGLKLKLTSVVLGVIAMILGLAAQSSLGWVGAVLGLIAIILRFVLSKPEGGPGQPTPLKPA